MLPLPWGTVNRIAIRFNEHVDVQADDLSLFGVNAPDYAALLSTGGFNYDNASFTATWTPAAPLGRDKLRIVLSDRISDAVGNALDGEWTDALSTQSGDGQSGGDFLFRFNMLPGDVDRSGNVLGGDVILARNAQFQFPGAAGYTAFLDVNGNGSILGNDVIQVRNNQFTTLPDGEPSSDGSLSLSASTAAPLFASAAEQLQPVTIAVAPSPHLLSSASSPEVRTKTRPSPEYQSVFSSMPPMDISNDGAGGFAWGTHARRRTARSLLTSLAGSVVDSSRSTPLPRG